MKRNWFIVLFTLIMIASIFAGGGGQSSTQSTQAGAGTVQINRSGTLPIVRGSPITLRIMTPANPVVEDYETNEQTLMLEKDTNINLDFEVIPGSATDFRQRLNLIIAAGGTELPDIVMGGGLSQGIVTSYGQSGFFMPLTNYYKTHTYFLQEAFKNGVMTYDEALKYITSFDGNIYGIPRYVYSQNNEYSSARAIMYEPWLQKLNLKEPNTTEELRTVLRAFRDNDPNGNGQRDELPMVSFNGNIQNVMRYLMTPFEYIQENYYSLNNGTVDFAFTKDGWREGTRYVKSLVSENLLDPSFLTQNQAQFNAIMNAAVPVAGSAINISTTNISANDRKRYEYIELIALQGPDGRREAVWHPTLPVLDWYITKNCKNVEAAFLLGDYMCSEKLSMMQRYGAEGRDWKKWEPGDATNAWYDLGYENTIVLYSVWGVLQNVWWGQTCPCIITPRMFRGYAQLPVTGDMAELANDYEKSYTKSRLENQKYTKTEKVLTGLIFNAQEDDVVNNTGAMIRTYVDECWARFVTGDMDLDRDWNSYLAELNRMGLREYIAAIQSCYNRMYK